VDDSLRAYVTGGTYSTDFPVVTGCYQTTYGGGKADGFITKLDSMGNAVIKSTYIGTSSYDQSYFIQKDVQGRIYVYGQSQGNFTVTSGVYSNPNSHQFISRLDRQLSTVNRQTVFGSGTSTIDISPSAFAVDVCNGNIYLSGWGGSFITCKPIANMPITSGALYSTPPNGVDFYLMALGPNFNNLLYGSYFGGNQSAEHVDGGTSRFDNKGVIYQSVCAGCYSYTWSPPNLFGGPDQDFPVTPGAWPSTSTVLPGLNNKSGNCNNGVFKLDFQLQNVVATLNTNTVTGCAPLTLTLTNATPGTGYTWYLGNGNTTSTTANPIVTFTNPGTYTVSLVVKDTTKCVKKDSAIKIITVNPRPSPAFTFSVAPCANSVSLTNTTPGSGNTYTWSFGDVSATSTVSSPTHTYAGSGTYSVTLAATNSFGCKDSIKQPVSVFIFNPGVVAGSSICAGYTTTLTASGGTSYTWSPTASLNNTAIAQPAANPTTTTIYTVQINNNTAGNNCNATFTTQVAVYPKPSAAFSASVNPCGGGANFTDMSTANISAWQWTLSPAVTSTVQNPYNFYSSGGTQTVTLIVTNTDGCKDTAQQIITIAVPPPVSINSSSTICTGNTAQLNATGGISYQWTPTVSLDISNIAYPTASPTVTTVYSVVITATNGCTFLLTTTVNVNQFPGGSIAAIADPPYVITGNSTTLNYLGAPGFTVTWYPIGSTVPTTGYTVLAYPDRPTTYTVVVNNGTCSQKATVHVDAYTAGCIDKDVFVPNTFTPNSDGENDIFIVRGLKVQEIYFAVYNRWGEMVFETTDKTKGWDGIYKGRPADVGVFGWYLKVKCFNGEETFRKGNVTLIR
jgi:gliding motility-associated-like protein